MTMTSSFLSVPSKKPTTLYVSTGFSVLSMVKLIGAGLNLADTDFFWRTKSDLKANKSASDIPKISAATIEETIKTGASFAAATSSVKTIRSLPNRFIMICRWRISFPKSLLDFDEIKIKPFAPAACDLFNFSFQPSPLPKTEGSFVPDRT